MTRFLHLTAFFVGLAAICWVGVGYIGSNPLALAITVLIGAFYLMGALELHRFHQATSGLTHAVADLTETSGSLVSRVLLLDVRKPNMRSVAPACMRNPIAERWRESR